MMQEGYIMVQIAKSEDLGAMEVGRYITSSSAAN